MVLGILVPCNMVFAQDLVLAASNAPSREVAAAVVSAEAAARDSARELMLGESFNKMVCDVVKMDLAHDTVGYRFVEDRARACADDVKLSRELGTLPPAEVKDGKRVAADHNAYLACMARECETRLLTKLFATPK